MELEARFSAINSCQRSFARRAAAAAPLLLALLALAFASTLWSIDAGATVRRAVWLALTTGFGLYLAWRYSWRELTEVLAGAFVLLIAGSFFVGALAPSIGRMAAEHPGAWGGLWTHKNTLGGIMALGVAICASAAWLAPARRKVWSAAALGALALVLLSTSMTALIASCLGLGIIAGAAMIRSGPMPALLAGAGALALIILSASVALLAPDILVAAIGRDLTLTGRTDIWDAAQSAVNAKPWLGYGYYAFWLPDEGPAYWVRQAVQWEVSSAHSAWLERRAVCAPIARHARARRGCCNAGGRRRVGAGIPGGLYALHVERKPRPRSQQSVLDDLRGGRGPTRP